MVLITYFDVPAAFRDPRNTHREISLL